MTTPIPEAQEPTRDEIDRQPGPLVLEFGSAECPICRAFAPGFQTLLSEFPDIPHRKIEDGKGKPLGRSFRVRLWPTLVFLRDGQVIRQTARPGLEEARAGLKAIQSGHHDG